MKVFFVSLSLFSLITARAQDTSRVDAPITQATVYFGYGAELTHQTKAIVRPDTKTIVIDQLSNQIDINSLQISCPEEVTLLSHRFMLYAPPAAEVKKTDLMLRIEDSIKGLTTEISKIGSLKSIDEEILLKTGKLIETAIAKNTDGTLAGSEVLKLVEFYNKKIETAKTSIYNYEQRLYALQERLNDLRTRLAVATPPIIYNNKSYGRLVLQVISRKSGEVPIALSYYTQYAGWVAVYDIRVNSKTNKVKMVYKASLTQTTGIDWKKTKLVLSTGTPTFGVTAPVLQPWQLQLYVPGLYSDLQKRAMSANASRNVIQSYQDEKALADVVVADQNYYKVERKETIDPSTLTQYTTLNEGQLNNNYEIDLPYDISCDGQLHNVNIKEEMINCNLKNYAVPRMDRDAYLLAEVADWQNLDLLPGDANIIMDDTYIGKSSIDPNSIADTLNFSLGKDKRLAVRRSLVKELSSLKTSGKESKQSFTYEIVVKNNKVSDVNLLLKDQFPLSTIKEVEVILDDTGGAMVNNETGVLTWKVDLKPGESKKIRFSYTVKYPKDKKIVNLK